MKRFLVLIVGIIFIVAGGFLYFKNATLVKNCTVESIATVVDLKEEFDSDGASYIYYPIIEYRVNDDLIKVSMSDGSNPPKYNINEKITILYNPNKTNEFIVKGDKTSNIISIVFMALGVFVTGYGIVIIFKKEN